MSCMTKMLASAALFSLIAGGAVLAQTPPPAPPPAAPPPAASAPAAGAPAATSDKAEARKKAREARKMKRQMASDCRKQAKEQKLTGDKRKDFIKDCAAKPM